MTLGPLHLTSVLVEKPWGGRRLADLGRDLPDGVPVGESWDVADLDPSRTTVADPVSRVRAGPHAGATLGWLVETYGPALLGDAATPGGRFPLLVKLLDAREPLSVQVHPPSAYAATRPDAVAKTKSWVVLDADPGAQLYLGVADGVGFADVVSAAGSRELVHLLAARPARRGDVHHVPPGTIHALGGGVAVAEVQTPSDTTYRLYDWTDECDREPRKLDVAAALASVELAWELNAAPPAPVASGAPVLIDLPEYRLSRRDLPISGVWASPAGCARVVLVIDGAVHGDDLAWPLARGGCVLLPASCATTLGAPEGASFLEVAVPARTGVAAG